MGLHTPPPPDTGQYNTMLGDTHCGKLTHNVWECCAAHIQAAGHFPWETWASVDLVPWGPEFIP